MGEVSHDANGICKAASHNQSIKLTVENFEFVRSRFLKQIIIFVQMEDIPPELIFNWDQTGTKFFFILFSFQVIACPFYTCVILSVGINPHGR